MPPLKAKCQQLQHKTNKRIVLRIQLDNATPHREKEFVKLMEEELGKMGGMLTYQPPNTPLSNCEDSAIFPAVAKKGTALGGLLHNGKYLKGEKLWAVI